MNTEIRDRVLAAVDRYHRDIGFVAPELHELRWLEMRQQIAGCFTPDTGRQDWPAAGETAPDPAGGPGPGPALQSALDLVALGRARMALTIARNAVHEAIGSTPLNEAVADMGATADRIAAHQALHNRAVRNRTLPGMEPS